MSESYEIHIRNPVTATINLDAKTDAGRHVAIYEEDLVAFVANTADYNADPRYYDINTGATAPRPTNTRPVLPANPNAAALSQFNILIADYQATVTSLKQLSDKIYQGLSPSTQSIMMDFASQHPGFYQRPWQMFDFIFNRHGTITAEHINDAKKTLRAPFDPTLNSLESHNVALTKIFNFLARANQVVNQFDQMEYYESSIANQPHTATAIRLYKNEVLFANRSYATMTAYMEIDAPDQIVSAAEFGYANFGAVPPKTPTTDRSRSKRSPRSKTVSSDSSVSRNYCFFHGYSSHKGVVCRLMLADPSTYTTAHLHANVHTTVPGGFDSNF